MYYIVNLETRSILTYLNGSRMWYVSKELAWNHAQCAQDMTNELHAPVSLASLTSHYNRTVAPWIARKYAR